MPGGPEEQVFSPSSTLAPGPSTPAFWQLLRYSHASLPLLEECGRRYGDTFMLRLAGYGKFIMLAAPEAVREVFRGDSQVLHAGENNEFLALTVGPRSVLVLDGAPHARQRRVLLPPLKGERMRSFFTAMREATLDAVRAWPVGQPFRALDGMQQITLRVILQAVLGMEAGAARDQIEVQVQRLLAWGRTRYTFILLKILPLRRLQRIRWLPYYRQLHALDTSLYALIDAGRRQPAAARGENMLADLLAACHEDGRPLDDEEIRDALMTLILAGHDSTATALAWALEQLVPRADVVARIAAELAQTSGGAPMSAEHLPRLEYLDAAIRESLRLRTIFPIVTRLTKQAFVAAGHEYPPGVVLCPCSHLVHRRADLYPEPALFRPERFLERKYAGHEWFPFGGGNRTCLGMAFALYEMKVVLSTLFTQVRLARPPGSRSHPVRRGLPLAPDDGVQLVVKQRIDG